MNNYSLNRCFILCISFVLLMTMLGYSQDKPRTIYEGKHVYNTEPPIAIVEHSLRGKNFSGEEKVLAARNWLKDLKLTIKNTSSKTIVFFHIELVIPKNERLKTHVPIPVRFGTPLFLLTDNGMTYIEKKNRELLRLGETVTVSVSEHDLKVFTEYLQKLGADDFDSVKLSIHDVEFDDFSGWSEGNPWQRDSNGKRLSSIFTENSEKLTIPYSLLALD